MGRKKFRSNYISFDLVACDDVGAAASGRSEDKWPTFHMAFTFFAVGGDIRESSFPQQ